MFPDKASSPGSILIVDDLRRSIHELVAARRDLADVVSKLPAFIADWDKALSNRYSNDIDAAGFGIDDGKTLAMHMQQVIGDAAFADMQDHLQAARQGSNVTFEVRFKSGSNRKQDADLFAQVALVPRQTSGENVGFLMLITDFTERKLAELALYDEKERIRVTLNSIGDAVIATDAQGVVTFIKPIAESMTC